MIGINFGKYQKRTNGDTVEKRSGVMLVNIKELMGECGMEEHLYPGKRAIKRLPQPGEHKSHCAVFDWRSQDLLRIEIKAGLSGKNLTAKELRKFPVSFQSPTYIEIDTSTAVNQNAEDEHLEDEEDDETEGKEGKGGGKAPRKRPDGSTMNAFSKVVEGKIPELGDITKLVVMGKEIAKAAFSSVLEILTAQIKSLTVIPVNIVAAARAVNVSVAEPGGGLEPRGHETVSYKYKGAEMFGVENPPTVKMK